MGDMPDIEFNVVLTGKEMTHTILVLKQHIRDTDSPGSIALVDKLHETIDDPNNVRR